MDEQVKQRLVGATVLVVLGIVFIPLILDGSGEPVRSEVSLSLPPPEPETETHTIRLDQPRSRPEAQTSAEESPATTQAETGVSGPEAEPAVDDPLAGWAVQVYSLRDRDRAEAERQRLAEAGYRAMVTAFSADDGTLYRVRVGPEQSKAAAERLAARVGREFDLDVAVVPHP